MLSLLFLSLSQNLEHTIAKTLHVCKLIENNIEGKKETKQNNTDISTYVGEGQCPFNVKKIFLQFSGCIEPSFTFIYLHDVYKKFFLYLIMVTFYDRCIVIASLQNNCRFWRKSSAMSLFNMTYFQVRSINIIIIHPTTLSNLFIHGQRRCFSIPVRSNKFAQIIFKLKFWNQDY